MKKAIIVLIVLSILWASLIFAGCNYQAMDVTYSFNYAYIDIPGEESVQGEVSSWRDFEDGDQIQVVIDGITYLTDTTRCVLIKK